MGRGDLGSDLGHSMHSGHWDSELVSGYHLKGAGCLLVALLDSLLNTPVGHSDGDHRHDENFDSES